MQEPWVNMTRIYNKAESNFENVIITYNDTALAEQFITEFNNIREKYYPDERKRELEFPLNTIIKRLEILKNYIMLADGEELFKEANKLKKYNFNSDLRQIMADIEAREFVSAIAKIQTFISKNQQLLIWTDPEIAALKLEIKNLENQLNAFDNEKIKLEKLLSDFQRRHAIELGEIVLEILRLRKIKFKFDKAKSKEAEQDERQYREQVEFEKIKKVHELTQEQKAELKMKFRKASVLCHPDRVADKFKKPAQEIFIELKRAYDSNDIEQISSILEKLEKGNYFKTSSETLSEKELLKAAISKLRIQIKVLESQIITIKRSEIFQTVSTVRSWDDYFNDTKKKLQDELDKLKLEVEAQQAIRSKG